MEVSVIIPCLNESRTLATCIKKALQGIRAVGAEGEVVVIDNGSTDNSREIAKAEGARVVQEEVKGYGSALRRGILEARGTYVIMADADDTYDFLQAGKFIELLRGGAEFVMGNRFGGKIYPKAMPHLHRWFGTPVLTFILRLFFKAPISDVNCGMRGFRKDAVERLGLRCTGMEFASEMLIKASMEKLKIQETPIDLHAGPPDRKPHLRSFRDGWRHLRVMLALCPKYLFVYPGSILSLLGLLLLVAVHIPGFKVFGMSLGISSAAFSSALFFMGIQIALFGVYSIALNHANGILKEDRITRFFKTTFTLERGLVLGGIILAAGLVMGITTIGLIFTYAHNLSYVDIPLARLAILSIFVTMIGIQVVFSSFFISLVNIREMLK
ncbi:MAG: glycosyltransferase family 2 protein [Candidatus Omnitrophota bacterium]